MSTKKPSLSREFTEACNYWLPDKLRYHITGQPFFNRPVSALADLFQQGMKVVPTEFERKYLIERLGELATFVGLLERADLSEAVEIARKKWNRMLSKEEILYLLRHHNGTMTVVLSRIDGASIKLKS